MLIIHNTTTTTNNNSNNNNTTVDNHRGLRDKLRAHASQGRRAVPDHEPRAGDGEVLGALSSSPYGALR